MAYATADDARLYCQRLTESEVSDNDLDAYIEIITNREVNPTLNILYDITSAEVTASGVVKEFTAMGAALEAMISVYGSSKRTELKADLEYLQEKYNELKLRIGSGLEKV